MSFKIRTTYKSPVSYAVDTESEESKKLNESLTKLKTKQDLLANELKQSVVNSNGFSHISVSKLNNKILDITNLDTLVELKSDKEQDNKDDIKDDIKDDEELLNEGKEEKKTDEEQHRFSHAYPPRASMSRGFQSNRAPVTGSGIRKTALGICDAF
jgi:hypothetical protein